MINSIIIMKDGKEIFGIDVGAYLEDLYAEYGAGRWRVVIIDSNGKVVYDKEEKY